VGKSNRERRWSFARSLEREREFHAWGTSHAGRCWRGEKRPTHCVADRLKAQRCMAESSRTTQANRQTLSHIANAIADMRNLSRCRLLSHVVLAIIYYRRSRKSGVGIRADVGCVIAEMSAIISDVGCVTDVYVPVSGARKAPGLTRGGKERARGGGSTSPPPLHCKLGVTGHTDAPGFSLLIGWDGVGADVELDQCPHILRIIANNSS
jgi:hypothetical protein